MDHKLDSESCCTLQEIYFTSSQILIGCFLIALGAASHKGFMQLNSFSEHQTLWALTASIHHAVAWWEVNSRPRNEQISKLYCAQ